MFKRMLQKAWFMAQVLIVLGVSIWLLGIVFTDEPPETLVCFECNCDQQEYLYEPYS